MRPSSTTATRCSSIARVDEDRVRPAPRDAARAILALLGLGALSAATPASAASAAILAIAFVLARGALLIREIRRRQRDRLARQIGELREIVLLAGDRFDLDRGPDLTSRLASRLASRIGSAIASLPAPSTASAAPARAARAAPDLRRGPKRPDRKRDVRERTLRRFLDLRLRGRGLGARPPPGPLVRLARARAGGCGARPPGLGFAQCTGRRRRVACDGLDPRPSAKPRRSRPAAHGARRSFAGAWSSAASEPCGRSPRVPAAPAAAPGPRRRRRRSPSVPVPARGPDAASEG